jgi:hypothetical protein
MVKRISFFDRHNLVWVINSIVALAATMAVVGVGISAVMLTVVS